MSRSPLHRLARASGALVLAALAVACTSSERGPATGSATGAAGATTGGNAGASGAAGAGSPTGSAGAGASGVSGAAGGGYAGAGGPAGVGGPAGASGAAGTSGSAGTTGSAGVGAGGITGAAGTAGSVDGGMPPMCFVTLARPDGGGFAGLSAGPGAVLRVHASISGYQGEAATPNWKWQVSIVQKDDPPTTLFDGGATIEIKLLVAGDYRIRADVEGAPECNRAASTAFSVDEPGPPSFLFRVTPSSSSRLPILEKPIKASDLARSPVLELGGGDSVRLVTVTPLDALGFPLASYVRLTSPFLTVGVESYTGGAPFITALAVDRTYQLLIVPDDTVAPQLVTGSPDEIMQRMSVTQGISVTGEARDEANHPVVGARVLLRNGDLPSTVGVSDAGGSFGVLTRTGTLSGIIVPPVGSGLPEAHISSDPGIDLRNITLGLTLSMKWGHSPAGRLTLTVRGTDGVTPVVGARVHVESSAELPSVGTLTVHVPGIVGDGVIIPTGSVRAEAYTDAKGVADLGVLRAGDYRAVVAPPDGMQAATTAATLTLPAAGLARDVQLASLVNVSGALTPAAMTPGTRVTAIDQGVLAPATQASAIVDAAGNYALALSPSRQYELLVEPPPGRGLARAVIAVLDPGQSPGTKATPPGLPWSGTVTSLGTRVGGALVQVFCKDCIDTKLPVAQGVSRVDGTLDLVLPDLRP